MLCTVLIVIALLILAALFVLIGGTILTVLFYLGGLLQLAFWIGLPVAFILFILPYYGRKSDEYREYYRRKKNESLG